MFDISGEVALCNINYEPAAKNAQLGEQGITRDDAVGDWKSETSRELNETTEIFWDFVDAECPYFGRYNLEEAEVLED